jgi:hypothetical protein
MAIKEGYRTTEFWVNVIITLVNLLNLSGVWDFAPDRYSVIGASVSAAAYAIGRGLAKRPADVVAVPVAASAPTTLAPPPAG